MTTPTLPLSSFSPEGSGIDLESFDIAMRDGGGMSLRDSIVDGTIDQTIEGASTLTIVVDDDLNRTIENSGVLGRHVDVQVDGLWWTLVAVKKQSRQLTFTFEEREVNVLRYYDSFIMADRSNITRAEFVLRMIREVKEIPLRWSIPELVKIQTISDVGLNQFLTDGQGKPITSIVSKTSAIPLVISGLTVKGLPATPEQIANANTVLQVGADKGASRKVMVCSIMTAITESRIINLTGGDLDSVGIFQQRASQGWPATRHIATDAAAFFQRAIAIDQSDPNISYQMLCQSVQRSAFDDGSNYRPWQTEAETFVEAFNGGPVTTITQNALADPTSAFAAATPTGGQFFTRGQITQKNSNYILTKENSWNCMNRLGQEVDWRAFCVKGTIFFVSEDWLFKSKPFMTISEDTDGIDWIDYDFDEGKKRGTATVTAHLGRWSAPPGSVVAIERHGQINGRWLVDEVSRPIFSTIGTITLIKPNPVLPEPTTLSSVPKNFGMQAPQPAGARNAGTNIIGSKVQKTVVAYAQSQIGIPYKWGAEEAGVDFDCSGLTQAAYDSAGIYIPRVAQDQYNAGPVLSILDNLQPGDLVFFGDDTTSIEHVGIYIGNGQMIDAPHTGAYVRIDSNFTSWTNPKYVGATRPWQL